MALFFQICFFKKTFARYAPQELPQAAEIGCSVKRQPMENTPSKGPCSVGFVFSNAHSRSFDGSGPASRPGFADASGRQIATNAQTAASIAARQAWRPTLLR